MRTKSKLIVCFLCFALVLGMIPTASISAAKKVSLNCKKMTIAKGMSKTIRVKNTTKKVTWKVLSGKKYITLKKKGKTAASIKGKKKGKARVEARAEKKRMTCTVTVKNAKKSEKENTPKPSASTKPTVIPTPSASPEQPSNSPSSSHDEDIVALKALIAEQRGRGATISEDINSDEYSWENGRLTGIFWQDTGLTGRLETTHFSELKVLHCAFNQLTSLDVSNNISLEDLECNDNQLTSLDVTKNTALKRLMCFENQLTSIDVSKNIALIWFYCVRIHCDPKFCSEKLSLL